MSVPCLRVDLCIDHAHEKCVPDGLLQDEYGDAAED